MRFLRLRLRASADLIRFFARLQIESVPLDFFDNVLLKDLTLEAPERVLNCFTVLNVDLSQTITSFIVNDETSMLTVPRCPYGKEIRSTDDAGYYGHSA